MLRGSYSKLCELAMSDLTKDVIEVILKHLTDRLALAALFLSLILLGAMLVSNPVGNWARSNPMYIAFGILGPLCYLPTGPLDRCKQFQRSRNLV